jgi:hypothetical protein
MQSRKLAPDLAQASLFFNGNTVGYMVASMTVGLIFDKFNKLLQMFVPSVALSVIVAVPLVFLLPNV